VIALVVVLLRFKVPLFAVPIVATPATVAVPVSNVVVIVALFAKFVLPAPVNEASVTVPVVAEKFRLLAVASALLTAPRVWPTLAKAAELPAFESTVRGLPLLRLPVTGTLKELPFVTFVPPL
jgi:hypothetical protein